MAYQCQSRERSKKWHLGCCFTESGNGAYYGPVGILVNQKGFLADQKLTDELWNWTSKGLAEHGAQGWP
jgi:hypothetical protein